MPKRRIKGMGTLFQRIPGGPLIARWYGPDGKQREQSTRCTDRKAAERILSKHLAGVALRRDGVIDATQDRHSMEGRKPLTEHIAAYIVHCRHAGHDAHHVNQKEAHLARMIEGSKATRLGELTADALERHLSAIKGEKRSARTVNFARQIAVAFVSWCVKTGRMGSNPLRTVPKQDETRGRRRTRRPLTDDEMARLLSMARERGREAWYLAAALAGLCKGDLRRLTWGDLDFAKGTVTISTGKAKRTDVIPLHPQLADALKRQHKAYPAVPSAKVFPSVVTDATRMRDFLRAGIIHRETVTDDAGKVVMIGKGKRERPKMRNVIEDADGRVIDPHALRTTLGTQLARAGVAPQIAQRIMRHSDYKTTLKHYTILGLTDTAAAMDRLPGVGTPKNERQAATGTDARDADPRPISTLMGSAQERNNAATRVDDARGPSRRSSAPQRESTDKTRFCLKTTLLADFRG